MNAQLVTACTAALELLEDPDADEVFDVGRVQQVLIEALAAAREVTP